MLTQDRLRELLTYDAETGVFTRRAQSGRGSRPVGKVAGGPGGHKYIRLSVDGRREYAHRLAWVYMYGEPLPIHIDHIDGDGTNNRAANLRAATHAQNHYNARLSKASSSGVKGVSYDAPTGKWKAYINKGYRRSNLGSFATLEEAREARRHAAQEMHGEFARA